MSFTTTQLTAIETAMASGILTVEIDGVRTTYQSLADLRKLRDMIRNELIASGAITDTTPRMSYAAFSRE
jgi:hypothetical protein